MRVLVVESNPADSYLIVEAIKQAGDSHRITVVEDSSGAIEEIGRELPDIVLLDLNVSPASGFEVLAQIRSDARAAALPVVIMSGSQNQSDVRKAYELHANCYITKPAKLDEFMRCVKTWYEFWLTVATLPPK